MGLMLRHLLRENFGTADVVEFFNKYHKADAQTAYELMNNPDKASQMDQQSYQRVMSWLKNNQQHLDGSVMKAYDKALNEGIDEAADLSKLTLKPISRQESFSFVMKHYLGGWPAIPQFYIGIFYKDPVQKAPTDRQLELGLDELVGVIIYGQPETGQALQTIFRPMTAEEAIKVGKQEGDYPLDRSQIISLLRMYIRPLPSNKDLPDIKTNLASMSMTRANVMVVNLYKSKGVDVKAIMSYSDPSTHVGSIYKATNAKQLGRGKDMPAFVDTTTGKLMTRKGVKTAVAGGLNADKWLATGENPHTVKDKVTQLNAMGYGPAIRGMQVIIPGKDRYVWLVSDTRTNKFLERFLKVPHDKTK